jgi:transposase
MWEWHELLAMSAGLDGRRGMGQGPSSSPGETAGCQQDQLVPCGDRFVEHPCYFWGDQTGPNPTDRAKTGSKHHGLTDGGGTPLATRITGANRHDVTQLDALVDAIPRVKGRTGRLQCRPQELYGDRRYDSQAHRDSLRVLGIRPVLAQRNQCHGSGLGSARWVVERTIAWLHQNRRLRICYEKRADIHQAFLTRGCILICHRRLVA